jgi:pimeloyl-ACP methyl ester carboxylesterase
MTAMVTQTELIVDGISSPLLQTGGRSAEAVVFVHGNPGSSEDWRGLVERAGAVTRALAWDSPGFGRADKPSSFDYSVDGYARHFGRCVEALQVRRVHLVAHDFGGPWALRWAVEHPHSLGSVILVNTGVLVGYRWHYLAKIWRTPLLGELFLATATRRGFGLLLRHGNPRGLPKEFVDRMYADLDRGTKRAILALYRATNKPGVAMAALAAALRPHDIPALVIWGKHDPYIPVEQAERQRATFPSAEIVIIEDSGHWPFVDNRGRVEDLVVAFLRRVVGSPRGTSGRGSGLSGVSRGS